MSMRRLCWKRSGDATPVTAKMDALTKCGMASSAAAASAWAGTTGHGFNHPDDPRSC